jgi:hypothetical protein
MMELHKLDHTVAPESLMGDKQRKASLVPAFDLARAK